MVANYINIQLEDFDLAYETRVMRGAEGQVGALVTFTGLVRDLHPGAVEEGRLESLFLEHYPGMTEKSLQQIVDQARQRWSLIGVRIIHRVGVLEPGAQIVFVGVSSAHRGDAFSACQFIMDYLKQDAPFWKKEKTQQSERWVEQKQTDLAAARRWQTDDDS